eukprot:3654035-Alexandrium_andersonii.AAC.1
MAPWTGVRNRCRQRERRKARRARPPLAMSEDTRPRTSGTRARGPTTAGRQPGSAEEECGGPCRQA